MSPTAISTCKARQACGSSIAGSRRRSQTVCPDIATGSMLRQRVVSQCRTAKRAEIAVQRDAVLADAGRRNVELAATRPAR